MKITYKIENYYPTEKRVFVVYKKDELPPMAEWVYVTESMSESEIKAAVLAATPFHKWESASNENIAALIGNSITDTYTAPVEPVVEVQEVDLELKIRRERNSLLKSSDWTQLADTDLTETEKENWRTYRQALRDITEQLTFPEQIVWPIKPQ